MKLYLDIYLEYYDNSDDNSNFFEMQDIVKNDFKKIKYILNDYKNSESKEKLIKCLDSVINSTKFNKFENFPGPEMHLTINLIKDYLIFSYYDFDNEGGFLFETPRIVILERNLKSICFLQEEYSIFKDEEDDEYIDDYNFGHGEIIYFKFNNNEIESYNISFDEYTCDLFSMCFDKTESTLKHVKDQICCANCEYIISPSLEDEIKEEQGYLENDPNRPHAGDCCLGIDHKGKCYCKSFFENKKISK